MVELTCGTSIAREGTFDPQSNVGTVPSVLSHSSSTVVAAYIAAGTLCVARGRR